MKDVKDMTLREIDTLQSQYREELVAIIKQFFDDRPMIERIFMYHYFCGKSDAVSLYRRNVEEVVKTVHLKID